MSKEQLLKLKDWLNSQEFYEICQEYRHAPIASPATQIERFNYLKREILAVAKRVSRDER